MHIHVQHYEATATARVLKDVTCEFCGTQFHYAFRSSGQGKGHAVYGIGGSEAANRAVDTAANRARARARAGLAPVACPKCGKLQNEMVEELKRRLMRHAAAFGVELPVILLAIVAFIFLLMTKFGNEPINSGWLAGLAVIAVIPILRAVQVGLGARRESQSITCSYFGGQKLPVGAPGESAAKSINVVAKPIPKEAIP